MTILTKEMTHPWSLFPVPVCLRLACYEESYLGKNVLIKILHSTIYISSYEGR